MKIVTDYYNKGMQQ